MASLVTPAVGRSSDVHTEQKNPLMQVAEDSAGRKWVYMKGITSVVEGSAVTYDELGVTALLAANAIGPVAFAGAAIDANTKYGWFCVFAPVGVPARIAANSADNSKVGRETSDGVVGDGRATGDEIYNCFQRGGAVTSAALGTVQCFYPYVDDANGA